MLPRRRWLLQLGLPAAAIAVATLLADLPAAAGPALPLVHPASSPRSAVTSPLAVTQPLAGAPGSAVARPPHSAALPIARPAVACRGVAPSSRMPGAWWGARPILSPEGTLVALELRAGRPGAPSFSTIRLPPGSTESGPVEGIVSIALDDGSQSRIDLLATGSACDATVYRSTDVIRRAILDPQARTLYFHLLSRSGRTDLGVWRLRIGAPGPPVRVISPFDAAGRIGRRIGRIWSTDIRIDTTGGALAVQSCGATECSTRIVDLRDGTVSTFDAPGQGALLGFDRERAVTFGACTGSPCPLVATLIAGGRSIALADAVVDAATITTSRGLTVVATIATPGGGTRAVSIDPATDRLRRASLPSWARLVPQGVGAAAGVEVAPGRVAVVPAPDMGTPAAATDLFDGLAESLAFDPVLDQIIPAGEEAP